MVNVLPFMGPQGEGGMSQMGLGMAVAASMVVLTTFQQFLLNPFGGYLERCFRKLVSSLDPNVQIKFPKYSSECGGPKNYESYAAIETYLSAKCSAQARRLKAISVRDIKTPVLCIDDGEGVSDTFNGITVQWYLGKENDSDDVYRASKKSWYYALTFRKTNRKVVVGEYLSHVMEVGKAVAAKNRQLELYSNSSSDDEAEWEYIMDFEHPAKFETLAMEKERKEDIIDDLIRFSQGRDYYRRIGKPWKRGYLLYGPPGTGKSTMIAAMANLLNYDVYDLELTTVSSNASLKQLLNCIPSNSILVIEDIDCSSEVTNQRKKKKQGSNDKPKKFIQKVTLSGLLNCLDGLFSANDGGRVIVFTTNQVDALDSALIRRGRMDKHIEMSFCGFEAFRVLVKNYLGIEEHELFGKIEGLLKETDITPADVAENLIRRNEGGDGGGKVCLKKLIQVLEKKGGMETRECHLPENLIRRNAGEDCGGEDVVKKLDEVPEKVPKESGECK